MVGKAKGKQIPITGYYTPTAARKLARLAAETRIRQAELLREALDDLLAKGEYAAKLSKGGKS